MKRYSLLVVLSSVFVVMLGCADDVKRGEIKYVQETEGLPGYTVYIREAETPKVTRTYKIKNTHASKVFQPSGSGQKESVDKKENKMDTLSPLYYYRSSNPVRLTRVRLRRF
jgi:hypothetical protein